MKKRKKVPTSVVAKRKALSSNLSNQFLGYSFLGILIYKTILILWSYYNVGKYSINDTETIIVSIALGICGCSFLYLNRKKLLNIDEKNWQNQQKESRKIDKQFSKTYPKLSTIPIVGFLYKKWWAEPLVYKIALLLLCFLAASIYLYSLTYYSWLPDEPLVTSAAKGYLETGTFTKWDFWMDQPGTEEYERAWLHTWMVAQSIQLFGFSEWSARIVSVVLGLVYIPIIYSVSYFFLRNRFAALCVTFVCILHPYFIVYFRRTRMYALLLPTFTLLVYLSYQALTKQQTYRTYFYDKYRWLSRYLNYNWGLVIGTFLMIIVVKHVHVLGLIIFPALFLFLLYLLIVKKHIRLLPVLFLGLLFFLFFADPSKVVRAVGEKFTFFGVYKPRHLGHLFLSPFLQPGISISILAIGLLCLWWTKHNIRLILIYLLVIVSIVLFVFTIDYSKNDSFRYIMHIIPFSCMLVIGILFRINDLLPKLLKWILPSLIVLLSIGHFYLYSNWIYKSYPEAQLSRRAYPTILNNIKPEKEGIISLFLSKEYMIGMGHKIKNISMAKGRKYTLFQLKKDLNLFEGTWITWATHKSWHLRTEVKQHINQNCFKYHGYGIDNSLTEVYYCKR